MSRRASTRLRWAAGLLLLPVAPLLLVPVALLLLLTDLLWLAFGRRLRSSDVMPDNSAASVVIPNWNGRDLLERYLPSVVEALADNPRNEIIVVDNGSTDGSAEFVSKTFPGIRVVALPRNAGFGGGSNAGFRAAVNDIVVLLNSDMCVAPDFLRPLLAAFTDEKVFAVSCQIFFSDPTKVREETGLTQGWWSDGALRVRHRIDDAVTIPFPCFYAGGGSSAFDRRKFLELGGFDRLLAPFYLEDTDLGFLAWKRGWKVLYQPLSRVWHEHRGTIGKTFSHSYIQSVLNKNFILFCWKNIHEPWRLCSHLAFAAAGTSLSLVFGNSPERSNLGGLWRAVLALPTALASRWRARSLVVVTDTEAFRRPLGGYFRDRFTAPETIPERLNVLFLSPYPIYPPVHGGGVFMYQTLRRLTSLADVHLVTVLDYVYEQEAHEPLTRLCASAEFILRPEGQPKEFGSIVPHAVREFANADLQWTIHRQMFTKEVDLVQLEYMPMGQYAGDYRRLACALFEHDIYFQSIARQLPSMTLGRKVSATFEYLRALRYELRLLPRLDRIQVCSSANRSVLASFLPRLAVPVDDDLRAGIDVSCYDFKPCGREPDTMLFLGNFRHAPNLEALSWFAGEVLPRVLERRPAARLIVVGADLPPRHFLPRHSGAIEMRGYVDDVRQPLAECAVFVCPILAGSGMRVKLLEAFAAGIPCVSTYIGAEGLADKDGDICALADAPQIFADRTAWLLENPREAAEMARRARASVETRDFAHMTRNLVTSYRDTLATKRSR